jgi:hypothetical protein
LSLEGFAGELTAIGPTTEDSAVKNEEREYVLSAMLGLRFDYRCALYLLFFEDMSYDEVGVVMKKSKGQIRGLVYRAKQALREQMERDGFRFADVRSESKQALREQMERDLFQFADVRSESKQALREQMERDDVKFAVAGLEDV